jgi:hypothetical protein
MRTYDQVEQRGFTRAVRPDESELAVRLEVQRNVVDSDGPAETFAQILNRDRSVHAYRPIQWR